VAVSTRKVIFPQLSFMIMEAVYEVHNTLGPGFLENVYEEALAVEFEERGVEFERQKRVDVMYKGRQVGRHCLDLVVDHQVLLELKAVSELNNIFKQQTLSYLKATGLQLGILINFGTPRVSYTRIVNGKKRNANEEERK
jgi:GxxExxY protein